MEVRRGRRGGHWIRFNPSSGRPPFAAAVAPGYFGRQTSPGNAEAGGLLCPATRPRAATGRRGLLARPMEGRRGRRGRPLESGLTPPLAAGIAARPLQPAPGLGRRAYRGRFNPSSGRPPFAAAVSPGYFGRQTSPGNAEAGGLLCPATRPRAATGRRGLLARPMEGRRGRRGRPLDPL